MSCPLSNLVIGGSKADRRHFSVVRRPQQIRHPPRQGEAVGFDADKKTLTLADGTTLPYDRLILSPGIDFMLESLPGLASVEARSKVLAAWKAGRRPLPCASSWST